MRSAQTDEVAQSIHWAMASGGVNCHSEDVGCISLDIYCHSCGDEPLGKAEIRAIFGWPASCVTYEPFRLLFQRRNS